MSDEGTLLEFDRRLEEGGWDKPARFFTLNAISYPLVAIEELMDLPGHPSEVLRLMQREGMKEEFVGDAGGLALVVEGWRHLTADEVRVEHPEKYEQLVAIAAEESVTGDLDEIETVVRNGWAATVADLSAPTMPEGLRKQVRNIILVLRTGVMLALVRDRGGDPIIAEPVPAERLQLSRVPHNMWQFLVGEPLTD